MTRFRYLLERALIRGTWYRLGFIALAIIAVSLLGGLAVEMVAPGDFPYWFDGVWWAFLRLTDPGYLGDDEGAVKRIIATVITVLGYVLFMGALIAIMTQWLDETLARLERGETPIALEEHLLVVGWGERTASLVEEFLRSRDRVQRFLARREGEKRVKVVLMVEELDADLHAEVAARMGDVWDPNAVILRAGSRLRLDHLERVNFSQAAAIVLPGNHHGAIGGADVATIKTLMSVAKHPALQAEAEPPRIVAELTDRRMAELADFAYPGQLDVVPTDRFVGRILAQNLLHPGLSEAYHDLLSHGHGAALFARRFPELHGKPLDEVSAHFPEAAVLGIVRGDRGNSPAILGPGLGVVLENNDHVVLVARSLDHTEPVAPTKVVPAVEPEVVPPPVEALQVLCLGWSHELPALVHELRAHPAQEVVFTVLSSVPVAEREEALAKRAPRSHNARFDHRFGDITKPDDVRGLDPDAFHRVLILGSTQTETVEETDARTLVAWLTAQNVFGDRTTPILVELFDVGNEAMVHSPHVDVVVRPRVVSALLAHVTFRGALLAVYKTLLSAGGPSLMLRTGADYALDRPLTFAEARDAVAEVGHILVGIHDPDDLRLLPGPERRVDPRLDKLLVLAPSSKE